MEQEVVKMILTQGIFAVLFVWLFIDTRKENKSREEKYINTIDSLANKIGVIEEIKEDVEEIKNKLSISK